MQVLGIRHTTQMMIPTCIWHFLETLKNPARLSQSRFQSSCSSKDFPPDLLPQSEGIFCAGPTRKIFLNLPSFLIFAVESFAATIACAPDLCFTAVLFLRAICFFVFPPFLPSLHEVSWNLWDYASYYLNFFVCFAHAVRTTLPFPSRCQ